MSRDQDYKERLERLGPVSFIVWYVLFGQFIEKLEAAEKRRLELQQAPPPPQISRPPDSPKVEIVEQTVDEDTSRDADGNELFECRTCGHLYLEAEGTVREESLGRFSSRMYFECSKCEWWRRVVIED